MTRRVDGPLQLTFPSISASDMGGTTGGERESNIRIAIAWDPGLWPEGGPETPDVFWEYYLNEQVAEGYLEEVEICLDLRGTSGTSFQPKAKPK